PLASFLPAFFPLTFWACLWMFCLASALSMPRCPLLLAVDSACSMPVDIGRLPRPCAAALRLDTHRATASVRSNVKVRFICPPCSLQLGTAVLTNPAPGAELRELIGNGRVTVVTAVPIFRAL